MFLHSLKPGSSEHSYGVAVARLAGVPEAVLQRAKEVLSGLELRSRPAAMAGAVASDQMSLFNLARRRRTKPWRPWPCRQLEALDVEAITPLEALRTLHGLQQRLSAREPA